MKKSVPLLLALSIFGTFGVSEQVDANDWMILASADVRVAEEILGRPDASGTSYLDEFDAIRLEVENMAHSAPPASKETSPSSP